MVTPVVVGPHPIAHSPSSRTFTYMHTLGSKTIEDAWSTADSRMSSPIPLPLPPDHHQTIPRKISSCLHDMVEMVGPFGGVLALVLAPC